MSRFKLPSQILESIVSRWGSRHGNARVLARAGALYLRAQELAAKGQARTALRCAEKALLIRERTPDPTRPDLAESLLQVGRLSIRNAKPTQSVPLLERALSVFQASHDLGNEARTLAALADAWVILGKYEGALKHYLRAFHLSRVLGDKDGEEWAFEGIRAVVSHGGGKFDDLMSELEQPPADCTTDPFFCNAFPQPPPGVTLRTIGDLVPPHPIGAVRYLEWLTPLVGDADTELSAPIVTAFRQILLLALQHGAEEVWFNVREDGCLDVRLRVRTDWVALPAFNCTGSALSRLLVLGGLEKGEEARSRPQTGRAKLYGVEMVFQTEPTQLGRENVAVIIERRNEAQESEPLMVCSGCLSSAPSSRIRVLPSFNEHVNAYVTTYRCERCWPSTLAQTRSRLEATENEGELASAAEFLGRYGILLHAPTRGTPVSVYRERLLQLLDQLGAGDLHP